MRSIFSLDLAPNRKVIRKRGKGVVGMTVKDLVYEARFLNSPHPKPEDVNPRISDLNNREFTYIEGSVADITFDEHLVVMAVSNQSFRGSAVNGSQVLGRLQGDYNMYIRELMENGIAFLAKPALDLEKLIAALPEVLDGLVEKGLLSEISNLTYSSTYSNRL